MNANISINNGNNLAIPTNDTVARMRGHHIVVINEITGDLIDSITFDTYSSTKDSLMADYLNSIQENRMVAIAVDDTGHQSVTSHSIIQSWGCNASKPNLREPFIFIGTASTNNTPSWQYCEKAATATYLSKTFNIPISLSIEMYSPSWQQLTTDGKRSSITINGGANLVVNGSTDLTQRGHNIVIISQFTGDIVDSVTFDTWCNAPTPSPTSNDVLMANYLNSIQQSRIVAVTIHDTGACVTTSHSILQSWGCAAPKPAIREPFIFIGSASTNNIPYWQYCNTYPVGSYATESYDIQLSNILVTLYSPSLQQVQIDKIRGIISINDGSNLVVHNNETAAPMRGHHIVVINEITGDPIDSIAFDTWTNAAAPNDVFMANYLHSIQENRIVAVVIDDTGESSTTSHAILQSWGCNVTKPVKHEPFIFIGSASIRHFPDWQYCEIAAVGTYISKIINVEICGGSFAPTPAPTSSPTHPTNVPTSSPTNIPTYMPSDVTKTPTQSTQKPTSVPTIDPTTVPTNVPTTDPIIDPTIDPTVDPTEQTIEPTNGPTKTPTDDPTAGPTNKPSVSPTKVPTKGRSGSVETSVVTLVETTKMEINTDLTISVNSTNGVLNENHVIHQINASLNALLDIGYTLIADIIKPNVSMNLLIDFDDDKELEHDINTNELSQKIQEDLNKDSDIKYVVDVDMKQNVDDTKEYPFGFNKFNELMIGIVSFLGLLILISYIDAKWCRINDYYQMEALIIALFQFMDMIYDCLFAVKITLDPDYSTTSLLFTLLWLSIAFIVIPTFITLIQLYFAMKEWKCNDEASQWMFDNTVLLYIISAICGSSFVAVRVCCSNLFNLSYFDMPLSQTQKAAFYTKRFYSSVMLENIPQLLIQMIYLFVFKPDEGHIVYASMAFSILSIIITILSSFTHKNLIRSRDFVVIEFEVQGNHILSNLNRCKNRYKIFRENLSLILGVNINMIEIPKPSQIPNGLRMHIIIHINNTKAIDINCEKLIKDANQSGKLGKILQNAWSLSVAPIIENITYKKYDSQHRKDNTVFIKAMSESIKNNDNDTDINNMNMVQMTDMNRAQTEDSKQPGGPKKNAHREGVVVDDYTDIPAIIPAVIVTDYGDNTKYSDSDDSQRKLTNDTKKDDAEIIDYIDNMENIENVTVGK